jgi:dTDP-4-amino-4,6-dideoxygalactose transaminase
MVDMNRTLGILGGKPLFTEPLHVGRPNLPDRTRFNELLDRMFACRWFTNYGPLVSEFQSVLEEKLGVRHCIPMCNGTLALELAYRAIGLKDEVIVPSFTFIATAHALRWQQITPVFCDIREEDFTIDPRKIEELITPSTSGIVGVHTYGNPCDHSAISEIAGRHSLPVIYDAAHAFLNEVHGVPICRLGDISVLSFHATKFFSTFEGGAVVTDDDELAEKVRLMMNFGFAGKVKDRVDYIGTNGKMTEVCAAMGLAMMEIVDGIRECNRGNFEAYREAFAAIPGIVLREPSSDLSRLNWQYVIITVDADAYGLTRDGLVRVLEAENVLARRYFYPGCHWMEPYMREFPNRGRVLPVTDDMAKIVLSLPTGESVTPETAEWIAATVRLAGEKAESVRDRLEAGRIV